MVKSFLIWVGTIKTVMQLFKNSETFVPCACVQLGFGRAMCDGTFAHFLGQTGQKMLSLEHPILF